jgi:lipopolysaccharide/colanic/teichoic acid biosynthesis glycosyltransferase
MFYKSNTTHFYTGRRYPDARTVRPDATSLTGLKTLAKRMSSSALGLAALVILAPLLLFIRVAANLSER